MNSKNSITSLITIALLSGCASVTTLDGPKGPRIVSAGQATENGQYAEVGIQFTSWGDFVAVFSPTRWSSPIETGGSLSWLNPVAWSDDAGRTGRILVGEATLVGGIAVAATSGGGGSSSTAPSNGTTPLPPSGGGGGAVPVTPPGG